MTGITNLTKEKTDKTFLNKIIKQILKEIKAKKVTEISLVLVGEEKIREINKKYRGKNQATDVLSFEGLDEIFICPAQVKKQARTLRIPFKTELTQVLIHGILHLSGYGHEGINKEAKVMKDKEEQILSKINF